jgi:OmpA-OmpF porin, OOP family
MEKKIFRMAGIGIVIFLFIFGNLAAQTDTTTQFGVYSNFTFLPGNKLLFYDDFAQEQLGDFPANWETGGTGEVVRIPGNDQTWFSMMRRSGYAPIMKYPLPENYTIEFDMMTTGFEQGQSGFFRLLFTPKKAMHGSQLGSKLAAVKFYLNHTVSSRPKMIEVSNGNSSADIRSNIAYDYSKITKGITHFSINVSKQRLQVWIDEEKVVDIPSLLKNDYGRYFLLEAHDVLKEKNEYALITNFRIAAAPENIRKLFNETNTFSTTGIYFNTNSAVVNKESYGLLKVIAEAMQAEGAGNFEIIGHTDSDGADDLNQQLSERRALAVKNILVGQFGIETGKLTTSGKGETQPVDDNKTPQGKANNRRVEIIKK